MRPPPTRLFAITCVSGSSVRSHQRGSGSSRRLDSPPRLNSLLGLAQTLNPFGSKNAQGRSPNFSPKFPKCVIAAAESTYRSMIWQLLPSSLMKISYMIVSGSLAWVASTISFTSALKLSSSPDLIENSAIKITLLFIWHTLLEKRQSMSVVQGIALRMIVDAASSAYHPAWQKHDAPVRLTARYRSPLQGFGHIAKLVHIPS